MRDTGVWGVVAVIALYLVAFFIKPYIGYLEVALLVFAVYALWTFIRWFFSTEKKP